MPSRLASTAISKGQVTKQKGRGNTPPPHPPLHGDDEGWFIWSHGMHGDNVAWQVHENYHKFNLLLPYQQFVETWMFIALSDAKNMSVIGVYNGRVDIVTPDAVVTGEW